MNPVKADSRIAFNRFTFCALRIKLPKIRLVHFEVQWQKKQVVLIPDDYLRYLCQRIILQVIM